MYEVRKYIHTYVAKFLSLENVEMYVFIVHTYARYACHMEAQSHLLYECKNYTLALPLCKRLAMYIPCMGKFWRGKIMA